MKTIKMIAFIIIFLNINFYVNAEELTKSERLKIIKEKILRINKHKIEKNIENINIEKSEKSKDSEYSKKVDNNKKEDSEKVNKNKENSEKIINIEKWEAFLFETNNENIIIKHNHIWSSSKQVEFDYYNKFENWKLYKIEDHSGWVWIYKKSGAFLYWIDGFYRGNDDINIFSPILYGVVSIENNIIKLKIKSKKGLKFNIKKINLNDYKIYDKYSIKKNIILNWSLKIKWNTVELSWKEYFDDISYKDKKNIYYNNKIIKWADYNSFKYLGHWWWADKNNLYSWSKKMDVKFDYDTISIRRSTPIDKIQAYTNEWTITHKEFLKMEEKTWEELNLPFPMKSNYLWLIYNILWIILLIWIIYFIIKKNTTKLVKILYYFYTIFVTYIWITWYYNYAIIDKKRMAQNSLSWIWDLFWENVIFPTFFMNNSFAHIFYSKEYLFWLKFNIYFPIILIIFSLLWLFIFLKIEKIK